MLDDVQTTQLNGAVQRGGVFSIKAFCFIGVLFSWKDHKKNYKFDHNFAIPVAFHNITWALHANEREKCVAKKKKAIRYCHSPYLHISFSLKERFGKPFSPYCHPSHSCLILSPTTCNFYDNYDNAWDYITHKFQYNSSTFYRNSFYSSFCFFLIQLLKHHESIDIHCSSFMVVVVVVTILDFLG